MYIGFNSDVMSSSQISDYLNRVIQPKLQAISGVANAEILGGQTFAMRIWLDPDRMAAFGVTPLDVSTALQANNFTTAAGEIKGNYVQTNINAGTSLSSVKGFENLVVVSRGASLIRLGQIARIELGPENFNSASVFDGLKAVFIGVYATPSANPLTVISDVRAAMPGIQAELPTGLKAAIAYDATTFIRASIKEVATTLGGSGSDRDRGDLLVPWFDPLHDHPNRHHPLVADRRADASSGTGLFHQSSHASRSRAVDRTCGRRCHRRGGEHPPPYGRGDGSFLGGTAGCARDRPAGDQHDHHAGRRLRAHRIHLGPHGIAVPRIRLHPGWRRHRLRRDCADALADDVLETPQDRPGRVSPPFSIACSKG